jgi:hypothetical protein
LFLRFDGVLQQEPGFQERSQNTQAGRKSTRQRLSVMLFQQRTAEESRIDGEPEFEL